MDGLKKSGMGFSLYLVYESLRHGSRKNDLGGPNSFDRGPFRAGGYQR